MLKSAFRFWPAVLVIAGTVAGCEWMTFGRSGSEPPMPPGTPQSHLVMVSGTVAPLTCSPDTVHVFSGDTITWQHVRDDVAIQVNLAGIPVSPTSLAIAQNETGSVVVQPVTQRVVYPYTVAVMGGGELVVTDPYIDVQPPPRN